MGFLIDCQRASCLVSKAQQRSPMSFCAGHIKYQHHRPRGTQRNCVIVLLL